MSPAAVVALAAACVTAPAAAADLVPQPAPPAASPEAAAGSRSAPRREATPPGELSLLDAALPDVRGSWTRAAGALRAPRSPGARWVAALPATGEGTLRARFIEAGRGPFAVVFGARRGPRGDSLEGYALRVVDRWAHLVRFRGLAVERLGDTVTIPRRAGRATLEARLLLLGDRVVAILADGDTGEALAILSSEGLGPRGPLAGVAVLDPTASDDAPPGPAVAELAFRPACRLVPPGPDRGPPLVATVPESEAFLAAGTALELEPSAGGAGVLFRTGTLGLERLFCEGRSLLRVTTDLPWKLRDLVYYFTARWDLGGGDPLPYGHSYKDGRMVEAVLRALAARHPRTARLEVLGTSHQGRPLLALALGAHLDGSTASVLLTGGTHADEQISTEIVLDAAATLLEARGGAGDPVLDSVTVWAVPLVNPDGLAAFLDESERAGRKNGRDLDGDGVRSPTEGVDLNRNFPVEWAAPCELCGLPASRVYRGPAPASEPETRALMALARREGFAAAIAYHVGDVAILAPYTVPALAPPVPDEAAIVAEEMARRLPAHPGGRPWVVRGALADVQGTDQDWLRHELGTVALLIESCDWPSPPAPAGRDAMLTALRPSWQALLARVASGPTLSLAVRADDGAPVVAEVRLLEQRGRAHERWLTRERDGRQDRVLPAPGRYRVEVLAPGYAPWRGELPVGHERRALAVTLRRQSMPERPPNAVR